MKLEQEKKKKLQDKTKEKRMLFGLSLMTPIKPQLAKSSKSYEDSILRNPNGFYIETKYDGERIQVFLF